MKAAAGQVLKARDVTLEGHYQLDFGQTPPSARPSAPPASARPKGTPQARIVETTADGAVIEVICSCGETTRIQCAWNAPVA